MQKTISSQAPVASSRAWTEAEAAAPSSSASQLVLELHDVETPVRAPCKVDDRREGAAQ